MQSHCRSCRRDDCKLERLEQRPSDNDRDKSFAGKGKPAATLYRQPAKDAKGHWLLFKANLGRMTKFLKRFNNYLAEPRKALDLKEEKRRRRNINVV